MATTSGKHVLSSLDADIQVLSHAKDGCNVPPAQDAFGCSSVLLTTIRVRSYTAAMNFELMLNQDTKAKEWGYVNLGWFCADVCKALDLGLKGRELDELCQQMLQAIEHLTM